MVDTSNIATFRVEAEAMRLHYARMRRVALWTLASCGPSAVASTVFALVLYPTSTTDLVNVILVGLLGSATPVLLVGVGLGLDVLVRARRGLSRRGDLVVTFTDTHASAQRSPAEPHILRQPIIGAQAFADHVQLTIGVIPKPLFQLELPVTSEQRAALLAYLHNIGVHAPNRPSFAKNLARSLALAGPAIVGVVLVLKLMQLLVVGALLRGLATLPVRLGALVMGVLAVAGIVYVVIRGFRALRSRG